jgi:hypothetical protein
MAVPQPPRAEGKGFIADGAKKLLKMTQKIQKALISEKKVYIDKT